MSIGDYVVACDKVYDTDHCLVSDQSLAGVKLRGVVVMVAISHPVLSTASTVCPKIKQKNQEQVFLLKEGSACNIMGQLCKWSTKYYDTCNEHDKYK